MVSPDLLSGMKKRHSLTGYRVSCFGLVVLVIIASQTGKSQVVQIVIPVLACWNDVVG